MLGNVLRFVCFARRGHPFSYAIHYAADERRRARKRLIIFIRLKVGQWSWSSDRFATSASVVIFSMGAAPILPKAAPCFVSAISTSFLPALDAALTRRVCLCIKICRVVGPHAVQESGKRGARQASLFALHFWPLFLAIFAWSALFVLFGFVFWLLFGFLLLPFLIFQFVSSHRLLHRISSSATLTCCCCCTPEAAWPHLFFGPLLVLVFEWLSSHFLRTVWFFCSVLPGGVLSCCCLVYSYVTHCCVVCCYVLHCWAM